MIVICPSWEVEQPVTVNMKHANNAENKIAITRFVFTTSSFFLLSKLGLNNSKFQMVCQGIFGQVGVSHFTCNVFERQAAARFYLK